MLEVLELGGNMALRDVQPHLVDRARQTVR